MPNFMAEDRGRRTEGGGRTTDETKPYSSSLSYRHISHLSSVVRPLPSILRKRLRRFEALIFVRARVELRQRAGPEALDLGGIVYAVTRAFVQGARARPRVREQMAPAGFVVVQADHLMADRTFGVDRMQPSSAEEFQELHNPYGQDAHGRLVDDRPSRQDLSCREPVRAATLSRGEVSTLAQESGDVMAETEDGRQRTDDG